MCAEVVLSAGDADWTCSTRSSPTSSVAGAGRSTTRMHTVVRRVRGERVDYAYPVPVPVLGKGMRMLLLPLLLGGRRAGAVGHGVVGRWGLQTRI